MGEPSQHKHQRDYFVLSMLALLMYLVFTPQNDALKNSDVVPAQLLPIAIIEDGSLRLNRFQRSGEALPHYFRKVDDNVYSAYSIVPGLLGIPVVLAAKIFSIDVTREHQLLARITSALCAALTVYFLVHAVGSIVIQRQFVIFLGTLFAFGTCQWSVCATAPWEHTTASLFLAISLFELFNEKGRRHLVLGLALGMMVWSRPLTLLLALPILLAVWAEGSMRIIRALLGFALPLAFLEMYNVICLGSLLASKNAGLLGIGGFTGNPLSGLNGLLFSPSRGLFVFTPVLLLGVFGMVRAFFERDLLRRGTFLALSTGVLMYIGATSFWRIWWGGHSFGYRLLIEVVLPLICLSALALNKFKRNVSRSLMPILLISGVWSIYVQVLGAFIYPYKFNTKPISINESPQRLWDLRNGQIAQDSRRLAAKIIRVLRRASAYRQ